MISHVLNPEMFEERFVLGPVFLFRLDQTGNVFDSTRPGALPPVGAVVPRRSRAFPAAPAGPREACLPVRGKMPHPQPNLEAVVGKRPAARESATTTTAPHRDGTRPRAVTLRTALLHTHQQKTQKSKNVTKPPKILSRTRFARPTPFARLPCRPRTRS